MAKVCHKLKQFSCWNQGDPNRVKMDVLEPEDRAVACAVSVASGEKPDRQWQRRGGAGHGAR